MTINSSGSSTERIFEIFSAASTPIEVCRKFVHDFPMSIGAPQGCCMGVVDHKSMLVTLSSYGKTPLCEGMELDIWGKHPIAESLRDVSPTIFQEDVESDVLVIPLLQNRIPVGALISPLQGDLAGLLDKYSEAINLLSFVGGFYLKSLNLQLGNGLSTGNLNLTRADELTTRQIQIIRLMAGGMNNREIAGEVLVSESTVRQESIKIYRSLSVSNRQEAVAKARLLGLVEPVSSIGSN